MSDLVATLSAKLDAQVGPLLKGGPGRICVVDAPVAYNVGDHLILLGLLDFIRKHAPQAQVTSVDYRQYSQNQDKRLWDVDLFIYFGGGNFGDTWPTHHDFRLKMMERFAAMPSIQFPQSIHFKDEANRDRTARVIGKHKALTLLFRDAPSAALAEAHFDAPVHLTPDIAFAMDPMTRPAPSYDYACLLRTDREKAADHGPVLDALEATGAEVINDDWIGAPQTGPALWPYLGRGVVARWSARFRNKVPPLRPLMDQWLIRGRRAMAEQLRDQGAYQLGRGRYVVTDRLHAHIMCVLLGIPHLVIDSFGGKISAYHSTWTHGDPTARLVENAEAFPAAFEAFQADYPLS